MINSKCNIRSNESKMTQIQAQIRFINKVKQTRVTMGAKPGNENTGIYRRQQLTNKH